MSVFRIAYNGWILRLHKYQGLMPHDLIALDEFQWQPSLDPGHRRDAECPCGSSACSAVFSEQGRDRDREKRGKAAITMPVFHLLLG